LKSCKPFELAGLIDQKRWFRADIHVLRTAWFVGSCTGTERTTLDERSSSRPGQADRPLDL
jgi:hypothetical protein